MKIIITEKQANKLFGDIIRCKCGHSWKQDKKDKHPFLCHMCGWDNKNEEYNDEELFKFWKNYKD
jgi:hypothetical protein